MSALQDKIDNKLSDTVGTPYEQVKNATATFGESLKHASVDAAAQAKQKAQDVVNDAGSAVNQVKDRAQETVQSAAQEAMNLGNRAKESAQEAVAQVPGKVADMGDEVASIIRRYPVQSVLSGVALGFILAHTLRNSAANS